MQAAGDLVGILVELAARVQLREHDFGGGALRIVVVVLLDADRDAAAVVAHRARAIRVQRDVAFRAVSGQDLVDRVVDDLVDHVVQARAVVGVADVHAGALAHGVEPLEHLDGVLAIVISAVALGGRRIAHVGTVLGILVFIRFMYSTIAAKTGLKSHVMRHDFLQRKTIKNQSVGAAVGGTHPD